MLLAAITNHNFWSRGRGLPGPPPVFEEQALGNKTIRDNL